MKKMTPAAHTLGWLYYFFQLLALPSLLLGAGQGWDTAQVNFLYYAINFAACVLIFRGWLLDSLTRAGAKLGRLLTAVVLGFLACYVWSRAFAALLPEFSNVNDQAVVSMLHAHPAMMFLGLVVLVPLAEECFYRGLMFAQVKHWGWGFSALAFAAVHVVGYIGSADPRTLALCFLQYIPSGLILAAACRFTGTIFAPILIHTAINAVAFIEMYQAR